VERCEGGRGCGLGGRLLHIVDLRAVLGDAPGDAPESVNIIVLQTQEQPFGLLVDEIQDTAEIVVKPLSAHFRSIGAFSGATVLGDGGVALILDVAGVAAAAGAVGDVARRATAPAPAALPVPAPVDAEAPLPRRGAGRGVG